MRLYRYIIILFCFFINTLSAQTITVVPLGGASPAGVQVEVEHFNQSMNGIMNVKIFSTHYGYGNTSQYTQYPTSVSIFDKLFDSSNPATTLVWNSTLNQNVCLNFGAYTTLTSAGATVPNNGEFYSVEVSGYFTPQETGTYYFGLTSDDGSDLYINGTYVTSYYGGHGQGVYRYGTITLTKGVNYSFRARMQEYQGGDAMKIIYRTPTQTSYYLRTGELGNSINSGTWTSQGTQTMTSTGVVTFTNTNSLDYKVNLTSPAFSIDTNNVDYISSRVLNQDSIIGFDWFCADLNGDGSLTIADMKMLYMAAQSSQTTGAFFSTSEYNIIKNSTIDLKSTYPPSSSKTYQNENTFYMPILSYPPDNYQSSQTIK